MRYSIDKLFHRGLIGGWVAANDGDSDSIYNVTIRTPEKIVFQTSCTRPRPDVKSAGFHKTGECGFLFKARQCGIREGDLLIVELMSGDEKERYTHSFFYANPDEVKLQFRNFDIPRNDFSVMNNDTKIIFKEHSHLIALKILIIRLRRYKRAKKAQLKFIGVDYEHFHNDWRCFYDIISTYREAIFNSLTIGNIFSIIDTIADCSDSEERSAALALSFYRFHERFAQTLHPLHKIASLEHLNKNAQHPIWGNMSTNLLKGDDAFDIYLTRAYEILGHSPLILSYFEKIFLVSMNDENSIFSKNINNSEHFAKSWEVYMEKFNSDLKITLSKIEFPHIHKKPWYKLL